MTPGFRRGKNKFLAESYLPLGRCSWMGFITDATFRRGRGAGFPDGAPTRTGVMLTHNQPNINHLCRNPRRPLPAGRPAESLTALPAPGLPPEMLPGGSDHMGRILAIVP